MSCRGALLKADFEEVHMTEEPHRVRHLLAVSKPLGTCTNCPGRGGLPAPYQRWARSTGAR